MYLNSIQFQLHAMSFNIFIQMKLSFHKMNSFFDQLISWLSLIVCKKREAQVYNEKIWISLK